MKNVSTWVEIKDILKHIFIIPILLLVFLLQLFGVNIRKNEYEDLEE